MDYLIQMTSVHLIISNRLFDAIKHQECLVACGKRRETVFIISRAYLNGIWYDKRCLLFRYLEDIFERNHHLHVNRNNTPLTFFKFHILRWFDTFLTSAEDLTPRALWTVTRRCHQPLAAFWPSDCDFGPICLKFNGPIPDTLPLYSEWFMTTDVFRNLIKKGTNTTTTKLFQLCV